MPRPINLGKKNVSVPLKPAEASSAAREPQDGLLTRERLKAAFLLLLTLLAVWLCFRMMRPFLPALTGALALAVLARKAHHRILGRVRRPFLAAALSVILVALLLVGPVAFLTYHLTAEAGQYAAQLNGADGKPVTERLNAILERHESLQPAIRWIRHNVDLEAELMKAAASASRRAPSIVSGTAWILMQMLITLLVLFYLFRDEADVLRAIRRSLPLSMDESEHLFTRIDDTIHATIFGSLAIAAVQGTMGGLMFWWLGLPAPLLWGTVMGLLAVIPNLGTFVVWGPAAAMLALSGEYGSAAILAVWGLCAIGLIDNLIYPILVGERMQLHPLLVFFAVLGGLTVFGTAGIVLGPVTAAVLIAFVEVWRRRTMGGDAADQPGGPPDVPLPSKTNA